MVFHFTILTACVYNTLMEIFACNTLVDISRLKDSDYALLSLKEFSQRASKITLKAFLAFARTRPDLAKRVYIEALAPLAQMDVQRAGEFLDQLKDQAAGFYISDDGFLQLAKERGIEDQIIFCSETLLINALDVRFYLKQNVQALALSPLLESEQIVRLLDRLEQSERKKIEIILSGKKLLMESKRPFLSNYFDQTGIERKARDQTYFMKEKSRDYFFEIMESEKGSLIYDHQPFDLSSQKERFRQMGVERFRWENQREKVNG